MLSKVIYLCFYGYVAMFLWVCGYVTKDACDFLFQRSTHHVNLTQSPVKDQRDKLSQLSRRSLHVLSAKPEL